jgi:hypothetical protein
MKRMYYKRYKSSDCYTYTDEEVSYFSQNHVPLYPKLQRWEVNIDLCKKKQDNIVNLAEMGPFSNMATITFQKLVKRPEALRLASLVQIRANRNLSKYLKLDNFFMKGVAVIEEACIIRGDQAMPSAFVHGAKLNFDKNYHFHILIKEAPCDDKGEESSFIQKSYWMAARNLKCLDGKSIAISRSDGVHVRKVTSDIAAASYPMKDSGTFKWSWGEDVFYLSETGLS